MKFFDIENILFHISIPFTESTYDLSYIEAIGTICGFLCIYFASKEKVINYLFGIINVTLFAIIFYQINLYASLLLQVFFFVANIYGFYAWSFKVNSRNEKLTIKWLSLLQNTILVIFVIIATGILSIYIDQVFQLLTNITTYIFKLESIIIEPDANPILDSAVTILSIIAMILMIYKKVENWIIWIIINIMSVVLYIQSGTYFMALEYLLLIVLSSYALKEWINKASLNKHLGKLKNSK